VRARELRDLSDEELERRLGETRRDLVNIRFQSVTGSLENTGRLAATKRDIARILTVKHERARLGKA